MSEEEFYSNAITFDELGRQVDVFEKEKVKYQQEIEQLQNRITELEASIQEANDNATWWHNRYNAMEEINKQHQELNQELRQKLDCKEILKQGMPENTEFVILTKANYDRQQKDIELELIDYKLRVEKAIEYIEENNFHYMNEYALERFRNDLLNILQDKEEV